MKSSALAAPFFALALASACNPARPPPDPSRAAAATSSPPTAACAARDRVCPAGQSCIAFRNYSGQAEHRCDVPCGEERSCPQGYACTDYDDGPESVCRPLLH